MNSRASALYSTTPSMRPGCCPRPQRPKNLSTSISPIPMNNRLEFLKTPEAPRKPSPRRPQRQRLGQRTNSPPRRQLNDRFQLLKVNDTVPNKKTTFVAMPTRQQWNEGYRPGWILRNDKSPPENYDVGYKMYLNYLKTGEVVFDDYKPVVDKAKNIGTTYLNKQNRKR